MSAEERWTDHLFERDQARQFLPSNLEFQMIKGEDRPLCTNCFKSKAAIIMDRTKDEYCGLCATEVFPELKYTLTVYDDGSVE